MGTCERCKWWDIGYLDHFNEGQPSLGHCANDRAWDRDDFDGRVEFLAASRTRPPGTAVWRTLWNDECGEFDKGERIFNAGKKRDRAKAPQGIVIKKPDDKPCLTCEWWDPDFFAQNEAHPLRGVCHSEVAKSHEDFPGEYMNLGDWRSKLVKVWVTGHTDSCPQHCATGRRLFRHGEEVSQHIDWISIYGDASARSWAKFRESRTDFNPHDAQRQRLLNEAWNRASPVMTPVQQWALSDASAEHLRFAGVQSGRMWYGGG